LNKIVFQCFRDNVLYGSLQRASDQVGAVIAGDNW